MTVKEFRKMCDFSDVTVEYYIVTTERDIPLWFVYSKNKWLDADTWGYDDNDKLTADLILTQEELNDAEVISVKLGDFTKIRVRIQKNERKVIKNENLFLQC